MGGDLEHRAVGRRRVAPDLGDRGVERAAGQQVGGGDVGVEAATCQHPVGDIAVDVAAEDRRADEQRRPPQREQGPGPPRRQHAVARVHADRGPREGQQGQAHVHDEVPSVVTDVPDAQPPPSRSAGVGSLPPRPPPAPRPVTPRVPTTAGNASGSRATVPPTLDCMIACLPLAPGPAPTPGARTRQKITGGGPGRRVAPRRRAALTDAGRPRGRSGGGAGSASAGSSRGPARRH